MLPFNPERVLTNARAATTEDLLDRVTVYRAGMEPEAIEIIEAELRTRDIGQAEIEAHAHRRRDSLMLADGTAVKCTFCHRPAASRAWGWQRLWGKLPVFPRYLRLCKVHASKKV
jgi:hypothetical protein